MVSGQLKDQTYIFHIHKSMPRKFSNQIPHSSTLRRNTNISSVYLRAEPLVSIQINQSGMPLKKDWTLATWQCRIKQHASRLLLPGISAVHLGPILKWTHISAFRKWISMLTCSVCLRARTRLCLLYIHVYRSHVFLMSQYRSAFQIKIMGSRAGMKEKGVCGRCIQSWGRGTTFLRPDVGGKLKISLASWRGSRAADTHCSVRELAAGPVSAHSRPIMLLVMCVSPPPAPALLPL